MSQQVASSAARGGGIMVAGSITTIVIQLISVAVLSRLLGPEAFGLVAMVGVFVALGNLLRDFGMPVAALGAKDLSHQQASNLFWVNLALAAVSALLLALATPLIVVLYSEPRLGGLVPTFAAVIFIGGLGAQIQVWLAREMRYKALVVSDLAGQVGGLALAVAFALAGLDYWALAVQAVVTAFVTLVMRWFTSGWVPARFRRGHDSARMVKAGFQYGAAQFLTFLQSNMDTLIIGARLGATSLGFYNRGYQILTAPSGRLISPLTQVVVPALNRARAHGRAYEPLLLRLQFIVGAGMVWLFMLAAGAADRLVPWVLGKGWDQTVSVFKILALGSCFWVLSTVSYWAFILNDLSKELLHYNLVSKPLAVACLAVGSFYGIEGVAWGYVVAMGLSWPINLAWLAWRASLPAWDFAGNGLIILSVGLLGGVAATVTTSVAVALPSLVAVVMGVVAGTVVMVAGFLLVPSARRHMVGALGLVRLVMGKGEGEVE